MIGQGVRGQRLGVKDMTEGAGRGSQELDMVKQRVRKTRCRGEELGQGSRVQQAVGRVDWRSRDTTGKAEKARGLCLWLGGRRAELGSTSRRVIG